MQLRAVPLGPVCSTKILNGSREAKGRDGYLALDLLLEVGDRLLGGVLGLVHVAVVHPHLLQG